MSHRQGDAEPDYRDLQERNKRSERSREEKLERLVELRRERHLHSFQSPSVGLGTDEPILD